jgi:hypothetical protein
MSGRQLDYETPVRGRARRWWRWAAAAGAVLLISLFYALPILVTAMRWDFPAPYEPPTTTPSTQRSWEGESTIEPPTGTQSLAAPQKTTGPPGRSAPEVV